MTHSALLIAGGALLTSVLGGASLQTDRLPRGATPARCTTAPARVGGTAPRPRREAPSRKSGAARLRRREPTARDRRGAVDAGGGARSMLRNATVEPSAAQASSCGSRRRGNKQPYSRHKVPSRNVRAGSWSRNAKQRSRQSAPPRSRRAGSWSTNAKLHSRQSGLARSRRRLLQRAKSPRSRVV